MAKRKKARKLIKMSPFENASASITIRQPQIQGHFVTLQVDCILRVDLVTDPYTFTVVMAAYTSAGDTAVEGQTAVQVLPYALSVSEPASLQLKHYAPPGDYTFMAIVVADNQVDVLASTPAVPYTVPH